MSMRNIVRVRLPRELLPILCRAIHHPDLGVALPKSEDRCARRASSSDYEDLRSCQVEPLFQRANYSRDIGVESVELAILGTNQSVAGTNLGAESVRLIKMFDDLLLQRHGDA